MKITSLLLVAPFTYAAKHPGLLHTEADFDRIRDFVNDKREPWLTGWNKLVARTDPDYQPGAAAIVCRGASWCNPENYPVLYRDAHAAYVNAIYWKITGNEAYADAAGRILDEWASTLEEITGSTDRMLVAGIQGYQLANAAEILRTYSSWKGLTAFVEMMSAVFLPLNDDFLRNHFDADINHYWANWDLANLASLHAIGVISDNQTAIDQAVDYFKTGDGMGAINNAIWYVHREEGSGKSLGQGQEAGRDQGHSTLDFALLGVLAQQSYNQGEDLFALNNNLILAGAEYAFKYNTGHDVPFQTYVNPDQGTQTQISDGGRGSARPIAELLYGHYDGVKGLNASWTEAYRDQIVADAGGAEGGGGDYGSTSGGYDQLGFGTVLFRLN